MTISIISALEAKDKLASGALLIDIRQPEEYQREHIEGAMLQPLSELQRQGLDNKQVALFSTVNPVQEPVANRRFSNNWHKSIIAKHIFFKMG